MKAKLLFGRVVEVNDDKITVVVESSSGHERTELPLGIELNEEWVGENLGKEFSIVVVDGKVMGFRD